MKALGTQGGVENLDVVELPDPTPGDGEVRVRVHASSLNSADLKVARGDTAGRFLHAKVVPHVPGYDFSGEIDAVGAGVDLQVGEMVFGHLAYSGKTRQGAFAELITIGAQHVAKKPDNVPHTVAACSATVGLTALQAFRKVDLSGAPRALVIGASGGVGSVAVGIAKLLGCHVTGVCSGYAVDYVRALGADEVIDRKISDPFDAEPNAVIFDTTGSYPYSTCKRALAEDGVLVTTLPSVGFALGKIQCLFSKQRCELVVVQSDRADLEQLAAWLGQGLQVPVFSEANARDAKKSFSRLSEGGVLGKIAIRVIDGF